MISFYYVLRKENCVLDGKVSSEKELHDLCGQPYVADLIKAYREGNAKAKGNLPAILFQGMPIEKAPIGKKGSRLAENMVSNRKYLVDLDHIGEAEGDEWTPETVWKKIKSFFDFYDWHIQLAFITPSGKGLKVVAEMKPEQQTVLEAQRRFVEYFGLEKWYDEVNIDFSRLSFVPREQDVLYFSQKLFELEEHNRSMVVKALKEAKASPTSTEQESTLPDKRNPRKETDAKAQERATDLEKEMEHYEDYEFRNRRLKPIVEEWTRVRGEQLGMMVNGKPFPGEVHSLHYNILRDIRNMCETNPVIMTAMIPAFGHSRKEILEQAKKVCAYNSTGLLPVNLWKWLKDKGYDKAEERDEAEEEMVTEKEKSPYADLIEQMPELPPILKDWAKAAPYEFKIPTIAALLEILGCCTTYAQAEYFDGAMHTTSFFTVIWAEAAGGKSFVKKFLYLHNKIRNREEIINARERLYDAFVNAKSDQKDKPEKPNLCKRILEPKFSEVQLFTQCFENRGAHLHTYCPEIDTLGRGVRGLSDLLRLAWDNDETGQQFRSSQTFKGSVRLYWNLLATGTPERVMAFFPDVLDGLVTRISIMPIFNTEFSPYQAWKSIPEKSYRSHFKLIEQFDESTYEDSVEDYTAEELGHFPTLEEFDKNVTWDFKVRPRVTRDLSFLHKPLMKWCESVRKESSKDVNNATYTFSKRSANKGFRAALVANELWGNSPRESVQKKILDFCLWWTKVEQFTTSYVFAEEYNKKRLAFKERTNYMRTQKFGALFESLKDEFTTVELEAAKAKLEFKSSNYNIIHTWLNENLIAKAGKNKWKKV